MTYGPLAPPRAAPSRGGVVNIPRRPRPRARPLGSAAGVRVAPVRALDAELEIGGRPARISPVRTARRCGRPPPGAAGLRPEPSADASAGAAARAGGRGGCRSRIPPGRTGGLRVARPGRLSCRVPLHGTDCRSGSGPKGPSSSQPNAQRRAGPGLAGPGRPAGTRQARRAHLAGSCLGRRAARAAAGPRAGLGHLSRAAPATRTSMQSRPGESVRHPQHGAAAAGAGPGRRGRRRCPPSPARSLSACQCGAARRGVECKAADEEALGRRAPWAPRRQSTCRVARRHLTTLFTLHPSLRLASHGVLVAARAELGTRQCHGLGVTTWLRLGSDSDRSR